MNEDLSVYRVLLAPHVTEKATALLENANQVVFKVAKWSNRVQIRQAVEKLFKVKVLGVQTVSVKGKVKRVGKHAGKRSDWKKAIVRLHEGETIDFFSGK